MPSNAVLDVHFEVFVIVQEMGNGVFLAGTMETCTNELNIKCGNIIQKYL